MRMNCNYVMWVKAKIRQRIQMSEDREGLRYKKKKWINVTRRKDNRFWINGEWRKQMGSVDTFGG